MQGNDWNALIRQEGAVIKNNAAPGGNTGVGKNAPFNLSDLKTVFYSTQYVTAKQGRRELMEGKSLLIPHAQPGKEPLPESMLQHAGFYREPGANPVEGRRIPDYFRLKENGAGIHIMGFNPDGRDWRKEAILSVINNFSYAVHHNRLVVNISAGNDQLPLTISSLTIEELFETYSNTGDNHYHYYLAIREPPKHATEARHPIGRLNVHIKPDTGPRRTAYVNRNGMLITDIPNDTRRNPISPRNKAIWHEYTVVAMAADDATDRRIRQMENPSHDEISVETLFSENERVKTSKALEAIRKDIADIIDKATGASSYGDTTNAEEMTKYAPEITQPKGETPGRQLKYRPVILRNNQAQGATDEKPDEPNPPPEPSPTPPPDFPPNPQPEPPPTPTPKPERPITLKTRVIAGDVPEAAVIMLTAPGQNREKIPVKMRLLPAGTESDREEPITILEASAVQPENLKVNTNGTHITLEATANSRIAVRILASKPLNHRAFRVTQ